MSCPDKNLEKLTSTPEGQQAFEEALVKWEKETGDHPTEEELDTIVICVLRNRSSWYRNFSAVMMTIMVLLFTGTVINTVRDIIHNVRHYTP